jgi:hypothetical protein
MGCVYQPFQLAVYTSLSYMGCVYQPFLQGPSIPAFPTWAVYTSLSYMGLSIPAFPALAVYTSLYHMGCLSVLPTLPLLLSALYWLPLPVFPKWSEINCRIMSWSRFLVMVP